MIFGAVKVIESRDTILDCITDLIRTKKKERVDCTSSAKISIISSSRTDTLCYLNLSVIVLDDRFYDSLSSQR